MSVLFPIVFIVVLGMIVLRAFSGVREWQSNNKQPVLSVDAEVVSKRTHVSNHAHNHNGHVHNQSSTRYFATFQVRSGDRMEFTVSGQEYGMLAEGDQGELTFQGTRYHSFLRK
ncbi:DUF2500 domain-containing protein [Paenibacillus turpanensis]|uniref:DUF2500 domain-containing protein n=1 Tax=Paenibacillus turpanensis TaxID=2689078 RepID=UPI001FB79C48|nr:DUF2500 domain-containing protein [Paenibacillus turpanensis]